MVMRRLIVSVLLVVFQDGGNLLSEVNIEDVMGSLVITVAPEETEQSQFFPLSKRGDDS